MSKSEPSDLSRINLSDTKDQIINKIKKAKTDPFPMPIDIKDLDKRPEARNLLSIYSSLKKIDLEKSIKDFSGKNFSEFKENLTQVLVDKLFPLSLEIKKLLNEKNYLDQILIEGAQKADDIASKKIKEIHKIMGF